MPGCAAIGCNNRSEKGYTMKCFPRDPVLRQIWKDRVGRADWEPSNNSFLCHAHFAPSQWMVTQCGRLKLRKGAVPSIFRVVSTRKSPNKRRRSGTDGKSEEEEFGLEILDDDEENYVYLETPGRIQNFGEESIVFLDSQNSPILPNTKGKEGHSINNVYQIITASPLENLQHENVIVISDDNSTGIGTFVNNSNNYIIINNENEDTNNQLKPIEFLTNHMPLNFRIKEEVKGETDSQATADEIYNEVESNMERIYEGINTDEEPMNESSSKFGKIYRKLETNKLSSQKNDSILNGQTVVGDNSTNACLNNSKYKNSINNGVAMEEDAEEENLDKRQPEETSNLEEALQRKRKAREETMKSIERFISDSVDETPEKNQNCSDSDFSSTNSNRSKRSKGSKFTIKFSGVIGDVSDIMRDLGEKPSMECSLEENKNQDYGDACITSVIRVENSLPKMIKTERISNSESEGIPSDDLVNSSSKFPMKQESIEVISSDSQLNAEDFQNEGYNQSQNHHNDQGQYQEHFQNQYQDHFQDQVHFQDHFQDQDQYRDQAQDNQEQDQNPDHQEVQDYQGQIQDRSEDEDNFQDMSRRGVKRSRNSDSDGRVDSTELYYDLNLKIEQQKGIILKLTDHLSAYKDMENKLQEVNDELKLKNREVTILSAKLNRKEASQGRNDRNLNAMQALIKDLTHKVKTIEDVNRRLSRSISVEHQNKKNLEYQVRSREKTIKELNWKVDKASKLLERAERNANTYKRRVNNMRSLIKRKHLDLVPDKQSPFDVMFSDYARHEFSEESLRMASEIQKSCGSNGYEMMLNYNFPLPSQRTLRRRLQKNLVFANGSNVMPYPMDVGSFDINNFDTTNLNNTNFKIVACDTTDVPENPPETSITVTGTVQDIFNESNDIEMMSENEVLSESELKEHLFKFMNVNF